jgi:hypothetical protein
MKKISIVFCFLGATLTTFCQSADTARYSRQRFQPGKLVTPVIFIGAGLLTNGNSTESVKKEIAEERNVYLRTFRTHVDDYLQFSPIAIAYGLDAMGYRSKTDLLNRTAILIKGELMMSGSVFLLKNVTHQLRPDNSGYTSFPSGHTAQAFAAATFLSEEYKDRFKWMPYAAYGVASTVGLMRMANNKHYISDVLFGAGLGYLSMKASYWTHRYRFGRNNKKAIPNL